MNDTSIDSLVAAFDATPALGELAGALAGDRHVRVRGAGGSARVLLAAALAERLHRAVVLVLDEDDERDAAATDLALLRPGLDTLAPSPELDRTIGALRAVTPGAPSVIIALGHELELPLPEKLPDEQRRLRLETGGSASIETTSSWLYDAGYELTDLVTEPGEFARRGGIVDVFSEGGDVPVRVEFGDSAIESLRVFDPLTQRSSGAVPAAEVPSRRLPMRSDLTIAQLLPARAVLVTSSVARGCGATVTLTTEADADFDLGCVAAGSYLGNFELLRSELAASSLRWFLACGSVERCSRLRALLGDEPAMLPLSLSRGFVGVPTGVGLLTERELYGTARPRPHRRRFRGVPIDNLVALRPGDHVVHIDYGVGVFEGTERIRHEAVEKDYLLLRYAGGDRVLVPVESLGLIDRYIGSGRAEPDLDRVGGRSWLLAKARAARASLEYARELLDITARRSVARGTAFPPDSEWHRELAAAFPFEETADQTRAIEAVREDMERTRPMDRLVCGDVGYGKTEVALRAAFKAVSGMKQVALLVPTTILCYQHFDTFRRRLSPFPLRLEMLSRLIPATERRRVLDDIAAGKVDIVIATHSLLAAAPRFRDLGLLIIDEEQKFGVRQKERIKHLRAGIDVLALSATPVPRTLYMALAGLRDISTIHTAPAGRREVATEISPWDDTLVAGYVERELARHGQVFFIHNRIQTLGMVERRLRRILPGLDIVVAHGQMPARRLEDLYLEFATGGHPILLSTSIVESGIDLPNVNTIIVDRADTFGLADLHQLRGRVGRSGRQAHALFLTPTGREITPEARKRLSALLAYAQLGAGFRLALRDLEIRGAGDLLGTRQHGQVARVGLSLYARMVAEASSRLRGEEPAPEPELALELNAFIPEAWVPDAFERVALYRRLLGLDSEEELRVFREELVDRFGRYPDVVADLFQIALVRIYARNRGLLKVEARGGRITLVGALTTETLAGGIKELLDRLAPSA